MGNTASKQPQADTTPSFKFKIKPKLKKQVQALRRQLSQEALEKNALSAQIYTTSGTLLAFKINEQRLKELQQEWVSLHSDISSLRNQLAFARNQAKKEIKLLEDKFEVERNGLLNACKINEENERRLKDAVETQKAQLKEVLDLFDAHVEDMESNLEYTRKLEDMLSRSKMRCKELHTNNKGILDSLTRKETERHMLQEELLLAKDELNKYQRQKAQLSGLNENLRTEMETLTSRNVTLSDENEDMKATVDVLKSRKSSLEIAFKESEKSCESLKLELQLLKNEREATVKEMQDKLRERDLEISKAEESISTLQLVHDKLTQKISDLFDNENRNAVAVPNLKVSNVYSVSMERIEIYKDSETLNENHSQNGCVTKKDFGSINLFDRRRMNPNMESRRLLHL